MENSFSPKELLYIRTAQSTDIATEFKYIHCSIKLPINMKQAITFYLEQFQLSVRLQSKLAKRLLIINKLVPLYVSKHCVLVPLFPQRAPIQYFINAMNIVCLQSQVDKTLIIFKNNKQVLVDSPYTMIYKKWQESLLLSHLVKFNHSIY